MNRALFWLLSCFLITLFCGLVYASVQQVLRQSANDPQIQIAEDMASVLNTGKNPIDAVSNDSVNVKESLSPFVMIFDKNGKLLASNADIRTGAKTPPAGIFGVDEDFKDKDLGSLKKDLDEKFEGRNEKIFTWQPEEGVRIASVLVEYKEGFVLSGRSLRETEIRSRKLFKMAFLAWILGIGASTTVFFFAPRFKKSKK